MEKKEINETKKRLMNLIRLRNKTKDEEQKIKEIAKELIERLEKENSKIEYESEIEILFKNLESYCLRTAQEIPMFAYDLTARLAEIYLSRENLEAAEQTVVSAISFIRDPQKMKFIENSDDADSKKLKEILIKIGALKCQQGQSVKTTIKESEELLQKLGIDGKVDQLTIFMNIAEQTTIEKIEKQLLPQKETGEKRQRKPISGPIVKRKQQPEYLSPVNRLLFYKSIFPNMQMLQGSGRFAEYTIMVIPGLESVVAERFFQRNREGQLVPLTRDSATYILPKENMLDLLELSKSELKKSKEKRLRTVNHRRGQMNEGNSEISYDDISYYRRFKSKFNGSLGYEYFEGFGMDERTYFKKNKQQPKKEEEKEEVRTIEDIEKERQEIIKKLDELQEIIRRIHEEYKSILENNEQKRAKEELLKDAINKLEQEANRLNQITEEKTQMMGD